MRDARLCQVGASGPQCRQSIGGNSVPFVVTYHADIDVVETVYTGTITFEEVLQEFEQSLALANEKGTDRYIADLTATNLVELPRIEIFKMPGAFEEAGGVRPVHAALVMSADRASREAAEFLRTVSRNRGWNIETFATREEAVAWLST